ncbi:MAG: hypothetical protein WD181_02815 [Solirubrobacterales bacterium]
MRVGTLAHLSILIRLTLLLAFFSALLALAQSLGAFGQAVAFGGSTFVGVVYSGMVILVLCAETGEKGLPGLWQALSPVLAKLVWVTLMLAVGIAAGLLLLIVPGLIVLTLWIVAAPVTVIERPGVFESLARSRELVRGNGLRVFLFLLLLGLMIFLAATLGALLALPFGTGVAGSVIGTFIVSAAVNPLTAIGPATLYNSLNRNSEETPTTGDEPEAGQQGGE